MSGANTSIALTHFAGRAGDHNDGAMLGSPVLAGELAAARPALAEMRDRYAEVLVAGAVATPSNRCWTRLPGHADGQPRAPRRGSNRR